MYIIELNKLTKKYGKFTAVDNVSFKVKRGEIFGFLGPNGAGKTTTVSMLTTLKKATSGSAKINGFDIDYEQAKVRESIGIVFQEPSLDRELTVYENLKFHAVMYGMSKDKIEKRIEDLLGLVDLINYKKTLAKNLSGGMKRRLEIARGFMHHPKVLFLDEPTIGLDPQTRIHIWEYIQKLNKNENVTVILTTHYMEEAEKLAHKIAIIDHGKIIALDTPVNLKHMIKGEQVSFSTPQPQTVSKILENQEFVKEFNFSEGSFRVTLKSGEKNLTELLKAIIDKGCDINSLLVHTKSLEDVYIHLTGKSIRENKTTNKRLK